MTVNIVVPDLGDSVVEATILEWLVNEGEAVRAGDPVVELETDKVSVEVPAEKDGVLVTISMQAGEDVGVGDVLGVLDPQAEAGSAAPQQPEEPAQQANGAQTTAPPQQRAQTAAQGQQISPVASRLASAENVNISQVQGTGPRGRVTKTDVQQHIDARDTTPAPVPAPQLTGNLPAALAAVASENGQREERIRMSRRRQTIAKRLLEAKQGTAMLTTFNEMDMSAVINMRNRYKADFQEKHGVKLGFSSFFVKAVIGALKAFPRLNAEIDGTDMVLKHYYDIGMAIGAEEGLVVPVIRDADRMTFAEIEAQIREYAEQVREGRISLEALRGGTFTITNGGVFGSLMSTPILNPPQVGILGLHGIKERPVAMDGEVVIRPMMYTALSYDHRIVDGREAVQFLVRVKELIENPEQLLLEA